MEIYNFDYIIVPKNSGLQKCRDIAFKLIKDVSKIYEVRGEDVPMFTEKLLAEGKKAIGITGEDLFKEFQLNVRNAKLKIIKREIWNDNFVFKKPALCLLGPKARKFEEMQKEIKICINGKYKELSKKYCTNLLENQGYKIEKIYVSGATEEFFSKGLADLVIDIVCTGKSADKAGLQVYEKLFESDIVIIGKDEDNNFDLEKLYNKIKKRIEGTDEKSYTKKLVNDGLLLKRKLIEEAAEVITAKDKDQLVWEAADLIYFLFVIMAKEGITIKDIEKENERRNMKNKED